MSIYVSVLTLLRKLADSFENMIHDNVDVYSLEVLLRNAFELMSHVQVFEHNDRRSEKWDTHFSLFSSC